MIPNHEPFRVYGPDEEAEGAAGDGIWTDHSHQKAGHGGGDQPQVAIAPGDVRDAAGKIRGLEASGQ